MKLDKLSSDPPRPLAQGNRIWLKDLISHNFAALRRASFSRGEAKK
jgi:hypothetical protein